MRDFEPKKMKAITFTGIRRVLEKAGFALEGVLRRSVYKNGQVQDSCMYALLNEQ